MLSNSVSLAILQNEVCEQVDAVKRNCIKVLPHMLVIHLKRFEYDYETMNRWKIKDRSAIAPMREVQFISDTMVSNGPVGSERFTF